MDIYIGLDGHSATCSFVSMNQQGKVLAEAKIPTTERYLLEFVRHQKGNRKLIFEESHMSKWFYSLLKEEVAELIVCNPSYLSKKQGAKTDIKDAWHLANELRCGHVVPVFHDQNELMNMRSVVGAYQDLVSEITRAKNRYKALFRAEALATQGKTMYKESEKNRIKELSEKTDQFVAQQLFEHFIHLERIRETYLKLFESNMKKNPVLKRLDTVPGIDTIRAHVIAAYICTGHRFKTKHKLWSYAMLVKHLEESDGRIYGKRVHFGRVELKAAFFGIAETVLQGKSSFRNYYDRLRDNGSSHPDAKLAVARKAAAICLAILKHNTVYDEHHEEKKQRVEKYKQI